MARSRWRRLRAVESYRSAQSYWSVGVRKYSICFTKAQPGICTACSALAKKKKGPAHRGLQEAPQPLRPGGGPGTHESHVRETAGMIPEGLHPGSRRCGSALWPFLTTASLFFFFCPTFSINIVSTPLKKKEKNKKERKSPANQSAYH